MEKLLKVGIEREGDEGHGEGRQRARERERKTPRKRKSQIVVSMCFISKTKGERKNFSVSFNRIYVSLSSIKLIQHRSKLFLLKN